MKLRVDRDQLAEAVAWTAHGLPTRPAAPVLAGMRLHAGAAELDAVDLRLRGIRPGRRSRRD